MNSQFSIGFAIALVIGIAVGALWPRYGDQVRQGAIGLVQDASTVSLAQAGENHVGRGHGDCGGGSHRQCSSNNASRGRGGSGCSGGCEESGGDSHGKCGSQQASARGHGGRGGGGCSGGCEESQGDSHGKCSGSSCEKGNCQGEQSHDKQIARRRGNRNSGQRKGRRGKATTTSTVSHQPCDHEGQASTCRSQREADDVQQVAANSKCAKEGTCDRESAADADQQVASQHRGPGFGPGFGMGRGLGMGLGLGPGPHWDSDLAGDEDNADTVTK